MKERTALMTSRLGLLLVAATSNAGTVYYVSPSGSDDHDGTSASTPWQTLRRASRATFAAGDTLLLARNGTWYSDPLHVANAQQLTVGAYGPAFLPQPLLQMPRVAAGVTVACVTFLNADRLAVLDLHLSGCTRGVHVASPARRNATDVLIARNFFRDIRTSFSHYSPANPAWAAAVHLEGYLSNATIRNNIAARIDMFLESHATASGMLLAANTVQSCSGNCYSLGGGHGITMRDSVLLRDVSSRLFLYGTTDVIVGNLLGDNALINNDFNARGEYQGGPDGCAFDFETASEGFVIRGNTFYRSWGAGIMIFGHETTSTGFTIDQNHFAFAGCVQNRGDRGGIAVMCPGGHKPQGTVSRNTFHLCEDGTTPAIYVNPTVPGCADDLQMVNNSIGPAAPPLVEMPQVSLKPPPPTSTDLNGEMPIIAVTKTNGATLRYTLDGSRPTEKSPTLPADGVKVGWPGVAVAINVRGFKAGYVPSVTNGLILEAQYVMGRQAALPPPPDARGDFDTLTVTASAATISGWVVDTALPGGGLAPVVVRVFVDDVLTASAVADVPRPDLPKAGVAPNAEHGFVMELPQRVHQALLTPGTKHAVAVEAVGSPSTEVPRMLQGSPRCVCGGKPCEC